MPITLDADGRPEAWGDAVDGRDIPMPPAPARDHRWSDTDETWIHDPLAPPAQSRVSRELVSAETRQAFRDARSAGDVQGQLDVLFEILTGELP